MNLLDTLNKLNSLTIFRELLKEEVIVKFKSLLKSSNEDFIESYSDFLGSLYNHNTNFSTYLLNFVLNDENIYIRRKARGDNIENILEEALNNDLRILEDISIVTSISLKENFKFRGYLPDWENREYNFKDIYKEKIDNIFTNGYGIYSKYYVFTIRNNSISPVKYPEFLGLNELVGYSKERDMVTKNTEAFLGGMKASNVLLYGDAGTGKSTTVKAMAKEYKGKGLRLIEVKKEQLFLLPDILEELSINPLKFIIFIDDLSFTGNDDNFVALKTILEGSVSGYGKNVVIYATTNRRHFVKESMKDRNSDELFTNDSIQETMSLAARFGLTITFLKPDKDLYLEIVENIAKENGLELKGEALIKKAEAFAIRSSGRSPRTAKQFVELEKIRENRQ